MKLFDAIDATESTPTPAQAAARNWFKLMGTVRDTHRACVEAIARDCEVLGMDAVLAEMGPDLSKEFTNVLDAMQAMWSAGSERAAPAMSKEPVAQPVEEESGV